MVVPVVVDHLAVLAHVLDTAVAVHHDVVVRRLAVRHPAREDVGAPVRVGVPVRGLTAVLPVATVVLATHCFLSMENCAEVTMLPC